VTALRQNIFAWVPWPIIVDNGARRASGELAQPGNCAHRERKLRGMGIVHQRHKWLIKQQLIKQQLIFYGTVNSY
jgi:hypothetical protein